MNSFWNLYIFLAYFGGIAALFWLISVLSTRQGGKDSDTGEPGTTGHVWDDDLYELDNPLPAWWRNLFVITLIFGLIYAVLFPSIGTNGMLLGWSTTERYEREMARAEETYGPLFEQFREQGIAELAANGAAVRIGERLYASYCAQCHGSDARGARGFPNLRDDDWLWGGEPAQIEQSILAGRSGVMPPWGGALGESKVREVSAYVLRLAGRDADARLAEAGKQTFDTMCVACHGPEGKGNIAFGAPDLTDAVWLYGGSPGAIEHSIANGRNGQMPAHENFLGAAKVHLLAAYIYSLRSSERTADRRAEGSRTTGAEKQTAESLDRVGGARGPS